MGRLESVVCFAVFPQPALAGALWSGWAGFGSVLPWLFELHWADVFQRRVQLCPVIPEQPVEGCVFGLADGLEVLSVQPFDLEGGEQGFRAGVIPAVALATHRGLDGRLDGYQVKVETGILAAPVAMEDPLRLAIGWTLITSRPKRIDDQLRAHGTARGSATGAAIKAYFTSAPWQSTP